MISVATSNPAAGEITRTLLTEDPQHPVLLLVEALRQGDKEACELAVQWALDVADRLRQTALRLLEVAGHSPDDASLYLARIGWLG